MLQFTLPCVRKTYTGHIILGTLNDPEILVVKVNDRPLRHIVKHSPTGFAWGYWGSGPADLALSILCDFFDERPTSDQLRSGEFLASGVYQLFKENVVGRFPQSVGWSLTDVQIVQVLNTYTVYEEFRTHVRSLIDRQLDRYLAQLEEAVTKGGSHGDTA